MPRNCSETGATPTAGPNVRSGPVNAFAPSRPKFWYCRLKRLLMLAKSDVKPDQLRPLNEG